MDILVIDDSAYIRATTRVHLQGAGYEVEAVEPTGLFDLLKSLHQYRPGLVITDYEMPFCNGETLIRSIREDPVLKHIPILVMSAHGEEDLVIRLTSWNLAGYILKPIKPEDLVSMVRKVFPLSPRPQAQGPSKDSE